ncbi:MAG: hypothetical protein AB2693_35220, partial [Candidatus Thiodiazotropha sp.]
VSIKLLTSPFRKSPLSKIKTSTPAKGSSKRKLTFLHNISFESNDITEEVTSVAFASDSGEETDIKETEFDTLDKSSIDFSNKQTDESDGIQQHTASEINAEHENIQHKPHWTDDFSQHQFFQVNDD